MYFCPGKRISSLFTEELWGSRVLFRSGLMCRIAGGALSGIERGGRFGGVSNGCKQDFR